jgi:Uma2 family endonuclease
MVLLDAKVRIPDWVRDLESFRRWATSDELPRHGRYSHLNGELWVDLGMERFEHNQIKTEFTVVLGGLVKAARLGYFCADRMLLTNVEAGLSTEPDALFVSWKALRSGRLRMDRGADTVELQGTPDLVLEVVSPFSVEKDTVVLRELYDRAGVPEYWLVDSRVEPVRYEILRHTRRGYVSVRRQAGWLKSAVFGKAFRLSHGVDPLGNPAYTLEVR